MFGIKLYKTYNKIKHILVKPKLKVMLSPMEQQPFYLPRHLVSLFNKHKYYNGDSCEYEYDMEFVNRMRKIIPFFPVKPIRFFLPKCLTFRIVNRDFESKWKHDDPCFERRGYFSIVFFGIALTFYLEIPLDDEEKYHEDGYYES